MKVTQSFPFVLSLVSAAAVPSNLSSWNNQFCATAYGSTSVQNPTTTTIAKTHSFAWTRTVVSTPTSTITPVAPTSTFTTTSTSTLTSTAAQQTDTTTTTLSSTETDTVTSTTTITNIVSTTSTASTTVSSTTTVGTVSGFTPVASVPSVVQNGGGNQEPVKREAEAGYYGGRPVTTSSTSTAKVTGCKKAGPRYATAVTCYKNVDIATISTKTITASKTSTITAATPPASSTTITVVVSSTTTVTPAATTQTVSSTTTSTVTTTSTTTASTSSTTTLTTTSTSFLPVSTIYAACQSNNLINEVGNTQIIDFRRPNTGSFVGTSDQSAVSCCNSCQSAGNCLGFGYSIERQQYGCLLIQDTTQCSAATSNWSFFADSATGNIIVGDGPCGQGNWLGQQ